MHVLLYVYISKQKTRMCWIWRCHGCHSIIMCHSWLEAQYCSYCLIVWISKTSIGIIIGNLPGDIREREVEDLFYKVCEFWEQKVVALWIFYSKNIEISDLPIKSRHGIGTRDRMPSYRKKIVEIGLCIVYVCYWEKLVPLYMPHSFFRIRLL